MKQHIINVNLNISKDTPAETLTELYAVLKPLQTQAEKEKTTCKPLYALNEDIEKLHGRYEELFKQVRNSLNLSVKQTELEEETLSRKYKFELEELSKRRKLEYDKQQAEIEAQADEQTPWRRGWWWRLIFQPVTNRAQDIIEERAELEADIVLTAEERITEIERNSFIFNSGKKLSKRELKKQLRKQLQAAIKQADNADVQEILNEPQGQPQAVEPEQEPQNAPPAVPSVQEPEHTAEPQKDNTPVQVPPQSNGQLQGQITLDELPQAGTRRPRPPRSCRKS